MSRISAFFGNRASTQPPTSPSTDSQSSSSPSSATTSPQPSPQTQQNHRWSVVQNWKRASLRDVTYKAFRLPSRWSSVTTPPWSGYASGDFMLGAGMVIIQPSTGKVVVCYDTKTKSYFLPKGRKDVNESLEDTAVREACEESGYPVSHFPLYKDTLQPVPPEDRGKEYPVNIEPAFVSIAPWPPRFTRDGQLRSHGGEYLTFWYVGQIAAHAQWTPGTGMADEQNYISGLHTFERAIHLLGGGQGLVVAHVWEVYAAHLKYVEDQPILVGESEGSSEDDERVPETRPNSV
ncbi:hypothetical protein BDZ89DRAFT_1074631 [Hymenopellis radicata]|nr:hypothetical protein BDZ89DRAFT_1074631 [Hymenopellis radicata]